mmetsp:Transcript_21312/g.53723  ORF Transcript_21312/g.53723 Transcript_21312/m.53723 type:complete len:220 (+) Transcript_21312:51-710(+)
MRPARATAARAARRQQSAAKARGLSRLSPRTRAATPPPPGGRAFQVPSSKGRGGASAPPPVGKLGAPSSTSPPEHFAAHAPRPPGLAEGGGCALWGECAAPRSQDSSWEMRRERKRRCASRWVLRPAWQWRPCSTASTFFLSASTRPFIASCSAKSRLYSPPPLPEDAAPESALSPTKQHVFTTAKPSSSLPQRAIPTTAPAPSSTTSPSPEPSGAGPM